MDKITNNFSNTQVQNSNSNSNKTTNYTTKNIPNDSFEYSNKKTDSNKKSKTAKILLAAGALAACAIGIIIAVKKGKTNEISVEEFKKQGGIFKDGKAFNKKNKPFDGNLIKKTAAGDTYNIEYKKGVMQKSTKNYEKGTKEFFTKEYTYNDDGKLTEVVNKKRTMHDSTKQMIDGLSEQQKMMLNYDSMYETEVLSKSVYDDKKITLYTTDFKKTVEGIRRSKLTDDEVGKEVEKIMDQVLDEKGIDKSLKPKIVINPKENVLQGGCYKAQDNVLEINPNSYKAGVFNLEDVTMHEGTHFEEALLRSRLDEDIVNSAAKDKLISRIWNGESDKVVTNFTFLGADTMTTPKMSQKMKQEFQEFASENLYSKNDEVRANLTHLMDKKATTNNSEQTELLNKIKKLVKDNPDFVSQYSSEEEAVSMLTRYSSSHNIRYNVMTSKTGIDVSSLPKLTPKEEQQALESLDGYLETLEGNARNSDITTIFCGKRDAFNNYQFSREEVLAQQKGNSFNIQELKKQMSKMKQEGTLTPEYEAYFDYAIKKSETTIEFKTRGEKWYQKFVESINHPENAKLKQEVEQEWKELEKIEQTLGDKLVPTGVYSRVTPRK